MIVLYRIYQICFALPVLIVLTIITALITAAGSIFINGRWWGYYPAHYWAKMWCILMFVRVKVTGRENITKGRSYVFIANHQGAYDIFSIYGYLNHNFKWMMKVGLRRIPFVGYACQKAGHIFVDSSSSAALLHTLHGAENCLKEGDSLVIFPEGSRTFTGKMGRFKRGAYQLAREFCLQLVPVTIDGAFHILPRTKLLPRYGTVKLTIHKPVDPPQPDQDLQPVMKETFAIIESGLPQRFRS
ncbi:MAG: 1-acyl-sn-glycerol-3-phosphate acyltransferase [Bacteroides sp.]|nr:1-acyl-sn-glycerol-3-phosphate acyltransferase [Bacteroides sp.]MDE5809108.1 1-acyl-sn-glycerol-3-phosphate acyltransferase [Muribaculaceae bacterium]